MNEMLNHACDNLQALSRARTDLAMADGALSGAAANLSRRYPTFGAAVSGMGDTLALLSEQLNTKLYEVASQLGWQVATYEIAPLARESGNEPIVWITGNSFMPPLRELEPSEFVWGLDANDDGELFAAYADAIESRLGELQVYLGSPDYDNALYVVDLARFEYVEVPEDPDSLSAEWQPIER